MISENQDGMSDWSEGWYCVRAKPRMELAAASALSTLEEVEVFLPRTQRQNQKLSNAPRLYWF